MDYNETPLRLIYRKKGEAVHRKDIKESDALTDEQICLGHEEDIFDHHGAIMPPIVQTSLFAKKTFEELVSAFAAEDEQCIYSRGTNPTVAVLEKKLALLERGETCKCFASGMAAISSLFYGLLQSGDHILFVNQIYGPTLQLATHLQRFGISHDICLAREPDAIAAVIRPNTRLIYFESPGTMTMKILDIVALTRLAKSRGILTAIDNTWATPLFQKPLTLGVDISLHTGTKYFGGHSDVIAGALVTRRELLKPIFANAYLLNGGAMAPMNAWLLIRGMRTLPTRLRQQGADALQVARFLQDHPKVVTVFHPALQAHERQLAEKQMSGYTGLFSFTLKKTRFKDICCFLNALRLFRIGVSWGGVESLAISPHNDKNGEQLRQKNIPAGLVRLSIGLEGAEALIADLEQALTII